ncbi:MAG TPA: TrbC/VirB2 family protein [Pseudomonadales bacterium]|nr:TrbC/VirB2 family protein [Pseudomonadales bacterium]
MKLQKSLPKMTSKHWERLACAGLMVFLVVSPELALAAPWDGPIQTLIDMLTGTTARLAAILAVVILGFMAMTGRMSWSLGGSIIGGIVLIFGGAWIVDAMIGSVH